MKLSMFGTGYVGLVQGAVFADAGHDVLCVDVDAAKIDKLSRGVIPIFEPGLERLVQENIEAGRLRFTVDVADGVRHARVLFLAVGTPPGEDGSADLKYVLAACDMIAASMDSDRTVVVKSTVPVGTCHKVANQLQNGLATRGRSDLSARVASNPEFLKEGAAVADCSKPDRIVIGCDDTQTEELLREIYAPFNRNHEKIIAMDVRSAELTKYAANCMLATKISFINEMANLADLLGADIEKVRLGIGSDPRIGYQFVYPGIGYGGSCFPKDVRAMIHTAREIGFDPMVLNAVEARNTRQKQFLLDKIIDRFGDDLRGLCFALWGLSFKPNTDDMREAPSRTIIEGLYERGARVQAYDPNAMAECRRIYGGRADLVLCQSASLALRGADALIVATEWKGFSAPDFDVIRESLRHRVIFDGRNVYDPAVATRHGLTLIGVGRKNAEQAATSIRIAALAS